jgi:AbrB family looped-hinge helix DNA binding protein
MDEIITTVTEKGQVTIPSRIREQLGIKPRDKVRFHIEDGHAVLEPLRMSLEETFGAVKPLRRPEDFDALVRQAKEERAGRRRKSREV